MDSYRNDDKSYMSSLLRDIMQQRQSHQKQASVTSNVPVPVPIPVPVPLDPKVLIKQGKRRMRNDRNRLVNSETVNHAPKKQPLTGPATL